MIRRFVLAAAVAAAGLCASAGAATLDIQFTGLDLVYDGTDIYDAGSIAGGGGDSTLADALTTVDFLVDGVLVGSLDTDIWADVLIKGVSDIPVGGGMVSSAGNGDAFGFDLITSVAVPGWGLALNLDDVTVFYTGSGITLAGGALASSVPAQSLPFGLVIDAMDAVTIAFSSSNLSGLTDDGTYLTSFTTAGTANVKGTAVVPEPSAMALLGLGVCGLIVVRRRK